MSTHAEIMSAYELLGLNRAKTLLDDTNHIYSLADAHFWLKWAMTNGGADFDWTFSLAVSGLSIFRAQDSYEDARVKLKNFIETGQFEQEEEQDPDIIINTVYQWVSDQYEQKAVVFTWGEEFDTHYIAFSSDQRGRVMRFAFDSSENDMVVCLL
jgi:hypothetical protein